jgi:hypothetical protein
MGTILRKTAGSRTKVAPQSCPRINLALSLFALDLLRLYNLERDQVMAPVAALHPFGQFFRDNEPTVAA